MTYKAAEFIHSRTFNGTHHIHFTIKNDFYIYQNFNIFQDLQQKKNQT